jgi:FAD/FMN-containing dehydrogenase
VTSVASTISHNPAVRQAYAGDASGIELIPDAVARPTSAAEVVALLESATATATPVTPAGGQSSTTAASITDRGILLSLKGLDRILDLNAAEGTVRVEAGVGIAHLKAAAAAHGFLFACDPTSEEEATIGGAIACNASGARSLRYGAIRRHVVGLDVVRANGEPLQLRRPRLEKNT